MKVVAITSMKGGTGKTSTTAALNAGLRRAGLRVLTIDADAQRNLSSMMGAKVQDVNTFYDVVTGRVVARNAIQRTPQGPIIAASASLTEKGILQGRNSEYRLRDALKPIAKDYDVCLIDTGPQLGTIVYAVLTAADGIIVPCKADRFSMDSLRMIAATVKGVQTNSNKNLTVYGVLVTMYERRLTVARLMRDELEAQAAALGFHVYATPIRKAVAVEEAEITGEDIFSAGKNNAAEDYGEIIKELLEQIDH
jgi:chromosome partitioning protein